MKREKIEVIGKLPKSIQLRKDQSGWADFSVRRIYHPLFAIFASPFEDEPRELLFALTDDKGNICTMPAWAFAVAPSKKTSRKH